MELLVTGGAGFIGSNFVNRVLEMKTDWRITVLDSLTYAGRLENLRRADEHGERFEFVRGDIRDSKIVDDLISKAEVVVHFAAESHNDNSLANPQSFIETNINGTLNLIQAAVRYGTRFHHISTDEVFGDLPLDSEEKFTDSTPYNPSSPYSASKAGSDHLVRAWIRSFGLQATISNCSNNYGPRQHEEKLIPRTVHLIREGVKPKIYGNGLNVRDWIHVDDHTDGILAILEKGEIGETYLLGANCERSNLQVVKTILSIMGADADFMEHVQDRPGHDLRYAIDASKSRKDLKWVPEHTDFEASMEAVVSSYLGSAVPSGLVSENAWSATTPAT